MVHWNEQLKAIVAGVAAALAFAIPVVDDGLTASEILGIALAGIATWQATYWTPRVVRKHKA